MAAVLEVENLTKKYIRHRGMFGAAVEVSAVRSVSFSLGEGEVLCMVGESGCGKSTIGKMVADVVKPSGGQIRFHQKNLSDMSMAERAKASLAIQLIHQDPFAALNPTKTIHQTLSAPLKIHRIAQSRAEREVRMTELLDSVGLSPAEEFLHKYPHQLSGGQRQRIVIARALTVNPSVIVADEATSMVDVSLRIGILKTLQELGARLRVATLFITHDFAVARYFGYGQQIAVMYLGEFVETGVTEDVIAHPQHPYTKMLLSAVPLPDPIKNRVRTRLMPSSDEIPDATQISVGCSFANRCPFATEICHHEKPELRAAKTPGHRVACHHAD